MAPSKRVALALLLKLHENAILYVLPSFEEDYIQNLKRHSVSWELHLAALFISDFEAMPIDYHSKNL